MKNLLLDSHALIVYGGGSRKFGVNTTRSLNETIWSTPPLNIFEPNLKAMRRPGFVSPSLHPLLQALDSEKLLFDPNSANELLAMKTKGPFDLMLVAQAKACGANLVTADIEILASGLDFVVDLTH